MIYLRKFNESETYDFIDGTYTVNSDGSIDVDGNVNFLGKQIKTFPVVFGKVSGNFNCNGCGLISLKGGPTHVGRDFYCSYNYLESLEYCPVKIGRYFNCSYNKLTSISGDYETGSILNFSNNNVYDFYGMGKVGITSQRFVSISNTDYLFCGSNPVHEIYSLCKCKEFVEYLNEFRPIRGNTILGKRLEECLYMCDMDTVEDIDLSKLSFPSYTLLD